MPSPPPNFQRKPLSPAFASALVSLCDAAFLAASSLPAASLLSAVSATESLVTPSFAPPPPPDPSRTSLFAARAPPPPPDEAAELDYRLYCRFRAYSELLPKSSSPREFERLLSSALADYLLPPPAGAPASLPVAGAISQLSACLSPLASLGFISGFELAPPTADDLEDYADGISNLSLSLAVSGDASLRSQILLQEAGCRLYPSLARLAAQGVLARFKVDGCERVEVLDYYLDPLYNSDPRRFEVKQVLVDVTFVAR